MARLINCDSCKLKVRRPGFDTLCKECREEHEDFRKKSHNFVKGFIMFWSLVLVVLMLTGCNGLGVDHTYGERPRIVFKDLREFCNKKQSFKVDIQGEDWEFTCERKVKGLLNRRY